jgi:hypothetical protein
MLLAWPDGAASLVTRDDGLTAFVGCAGTDRARMEKLAAVLHEHLAPRTRTGRVYALTTDVRGPQFTPLGVASVPLERGNYSPAVVEAFDHVARELASPSPCGRLVLVDGMPGTGKTHLVRGLLHECGASAMFVLVPPDLVRQLAGPTLLPALIHQKHEDHAQGAPGPIVLLLEDADECIAPRMADNIGSVANMLAFGDGIMGSVIDLRLVATTNRPKFELDSALLRPGRLCRRIPVGPLEADHAASVYRRLTGAEIAKAALSGRAPITLAEVYAKAREGGWAPAPQPAPVPLFPRAIRWGAWSEDIPF